MAIAPLPLAACLKYAELQTAAEAFLVDERNGKIREGPRQALIDGNRRGTRFTRLRAAEFAEHWIALDQTAAPATDFGGTLFKCIRDDPATGAMAGELVMSFRGTELIGDAGQGDDATSASQLKTIGSAWDRVCDMEAWYQSLRNRRLLQPGQDFAVTGYGLGGHLATIFSLLHGPTAPAADRAGIRLVVTFSGAGASGFDDGTGPDNQFEAASRTRLVQPLIVGHAIEGFGDTHSLVSIVDSLNVQNALLQMLPVGQRSSDEAAETLNGILRKASHLKRVNADAPRGESPGKAGRDALETVLNALAVLVFGPLGQPRLTGSSSGNDWHRGSKDGDARRDTFYSVLRQIQESDLYKKAVAGEVSLTLTASSGDLAVNARTDFGAFAALYSLSPFVLSSSTAGSLEAAAGGHWGVIYDDWLADKVALETGATTDELRITDRWLNDRAGLLECRSHHDDDNDSSRAGEHDRSRTRQSEVPQVGDLAQAVHKNIASDFEGGKLA